MSKLSNAILNRSGVLKKTHKDFRPMIMESAAVLEENPRYARIVLKAARGEPAGLRGINGAELAAFVADEFGGRLAYIEESASFHKDSNSVSLFARLNRETRSIETAAAEGWVNSGAGMYADPEDNLWEIAGNVVVRLSDDQMDNLLNKSHWTSGTGTSAVLASTASAAGFSIHAGTLVKYFNTETEVAQFGLYTGNNKVFDLAAQDLVIVEPAAIIAMVKPEGSATRNIETATAGVSATEVVNYFRVLYGENKEMMAELQALVNENLSV